MRGNNKRKFQNQQMKMVMRVSGGSERKRKSFSASFGEREREKSISG